MFESFENDVEFKISLNLKYIFGSYSLKAKQRIKLCYYLASAMLADDASIITHLVIILFEIKSFSHYRIIKPCE